MPGKGKGGSTVEAVWEIAAPIAESLGLRLWDVRFLKEGATWYLRIFIDKDGGVSIDDCVDMSHAVDKPLDDADPIDVGLAARLPGVRATLSEVTLDGRLRYWVDQGWVTALPGRGAEAVARLRADGPALTTWTDSMFALVITDRAGCRE